MKDMLKMVIVLSVICCLSGLVLASVKSATEVRIEEQVLFYVKGPALQSIFEGCDNDPIKDRKNVTLDTGKVLTVFPGYKDGRLVAVAYEEFAGGFGGDIGVMIGFDVVQNDLAGIGITTHKETPGIGSKVTEMKFRRQFRDHDFKVGLKSGGGDIDAVAGATISSTGTVEAVNLAINEFEADKAEILGAFK